MKKRDYFKKMAKITFVALGTEQLGISMLSAIAKTHGHSTQLAFSASLFHDRFNLEIPWISPYFDDSDKVIKTIEKQMETNQTFQKPSKNKKNKKKQ